ncbi:MAG: bifunctional precorrin-2 dehydrogenase/sirohydrochlorin ferrochelatase [Candidatus Wukongarchaeota archaeon]|nr:bifunctional precorrin-2 dehydrogenase/sirohydrochlorin ferrochelatase [Candidatus Wukongarchaeota archaeon]MDO8128028.1 bifunctional precorrin-2 dehydrogenase/sirohydrochlorin ferrochelatase [Candidatus Wukongarchaeota archaeon]
MVEYFPLFIDLTKKHVVIFGGGKVGTRKVKQLVDKCKMLDVVSESFSNTIKKFAREGKLQMISAKLNALDEGEISRLIGDAFLLIIATNDLELNEVIHKAGSSKGVLINRVDGRGEGNVIFPAIFEENSITVAVATSGRSPLMSAYLKRKISKIVREKEKMMVEIQAYARKIIKRRIPEERERKALLKRILVDLKVDRALDENDIEQAKNIAMSIIEQVCYEKELKSFKEG